MSTKVQIIGGAFQDPAGNPLANGYLLFELSQDGLVNGSSQIAAGREIKVTLDANGNVVTSPAQYIWPNDVIIPINTFYTVSAYTSSGQLVWGPNSQQVLSSPSPFDITAWVPASVNLLQGNVTTYDIGVFFPGQYVANQIVLRLPVEREVQFSENFSPSVGSCGANPTASSVFLIEQEWNSGSDVDFFYRRCGIVRISGNYVQCWRRVDHRWAILTRRNVGERGSYFERYHYRSIRVCLC